MKKKFDHNNPLVKHIIDIYKSYIVKALELPQRVEKAVLPIYCPLKRETKPEQIGSGVVVCIKDEYFVFTASHVFTDIRERQLLIGLGDGTRILSLAGDRFSTAKGPSGTHDDDPIDASVFHITVKLPQAFKDLAISTKDMEFSDDDLRNIYMVVGFRSKKSNTAGQSANSRRESFPSVEYGGKEYSLFDLNKKFHIALAYEDDVLIQNKWNKSPKPKGMSGGAIIKAKGIAVGASNENHQEAKQMLSAITIGHRREKSGKPGVLIGTRIGVHLGLIDRYLPNILDDELGYLKFTCNKGN